MRSKHFGKAKGDFMNIQKNTRTFFTGIGELADVKTFETFPDGSLKSCILDGPVTIQTPAGRWVPRWTDDGVRRKYNKSLSLYPSGAIRSVALHDRTPVLTSQGLITAEHVTFYENGAIHRVFPFNGRISGFWTQEEEKALASSFSVCWGSQSLQAPIMIFRFYLSGKLRSLTFWPGDEHEIITPLGPVLARTGVSFYEDGSIQSIEPARPTQIHGENGTCFAYDMDASGLHGDSNSLRFAPDGTVISYVEEGVYTMPMMHLCMDCDSCDSSCG